MGTLSKLKLEARIGASVDIPLRVETDELRFIAISGMTQSAPLFVTANDHGLPDTWFAAIIDVLGMTQMNAADPNKILDAEFKRVVTVDNNLVEFPDISSASFKEYVSGGYLAYYAPLDLSRYTSARMNVKRKVGGAVELVLDTVYGTLEIDALTSTVWIRLSEADTLAVPPKDYVFDIELVRVDGVDPLCSASSVIRFLPEVTTSA